MSFIISTLPYIGAIAIGLTSIRLARFIYLYSRPSSLSKYIDSPNDRSKNTWALVTGASDGIGLGFAHELAKVGFNVILHGRNAQKLEGVKAELSREYPLRVFRVVIADAFQSTKETEESLQKITASLKDFHITVLVNNIGGTPSSRSVIYKNLETDTASQIDDMIRMNALFPTQLTAAILPLLIAHGQPSLILNIGSLATLGAPWISTYSGSKAFNLAWSRSLALEMQAEKRPIEVLGILVGQTTTTAQFKSPPTYFFPSSRTLARATLDRVGCGRYVVVGYLGHALQAFALETLPEAIRGKALTNALRALKTLEGKKA